MCSWVWDSIMPLFSRNLPGDWKRWKARWERSQGGKAGAQGQVAVNCFFLSLLLLYSLWHLHPLLPSSTSFPGLWHKIPHMPLIWNDAAQEWSYLTAVEFSTLASDMSPEAIKQKEEWGLLSDWRRGRWLSVREIEGNTCFCLLGPVFTGQCQRERQDGEITIRGWEVTGG